MYRSGLLADAPKKLTSISSGNFPRAVPKVHMSPGRARVSMVEAPPASVMWKNSCAVSSEIFAGVNSRHVPGRCVVVTGMDCPGSKSMGNADSRCTTAVLRSEEHTSELQSRFDLV